MNDVLIGNVCSLCAMASDAVSGTRKKSSHMLAVQIVSQVFYGASSIILKGYSSTVQNFVAILRNAAAIKKIKSRLVEWTLIAIGVVLGIVFNNLGLCGWLPIVANLEYSVAVFRFGGNGTALKIAFIINAVMYSAFNLIIKNYVGAIANAIVIVTTVASLIKEGHERKKDSEKNSEE